MYYWIKIDNNQQLKDLCLIFLTSDVLKMRSYICCKYQKQIRYSFGSFMYFYSVVFKNMQEFHTL